MEAITLDSVLGFGNQLLASANVIIGFSLFVYILTHNWKSPVAQAFCALVACVTLVYVVEVTMHGVTTLEAAYLWLRVQWAGIICVPAAYLHFSDAVLRSTRLVSRARRASVVAVYAASAGAVAVAASTELLFSGARLTPAGYTLVPGPLFGVLCGLLHSGMHRRLDQYHPGARCLPDIYLPTPHGVLDDRDSGSDGRRAAIPHASAGH